MGGFYAKSFEGLVQCYVAAIPFFENQILGDLFFCVCLFMKSMRKFVFKVRLFTI